MAEHSIGAQTAASTVRVIVGPALTPAELLSILRLRASVFVVEQGIVYNDVPDNLDIEPTTVHYLIADESGEVATSLRVYDSEHGRKIGRVATAPSKRGQGLASILMDAVVANEPRPLVMSAQAYLEEFYGRWGFTRTSDTYIEEEIEHVWMALGQ
jgi:ElaA protein